MTQRHFLLEQRPLSLDVLALHIMAITLVSWWPIKAVEKKSKLYGIVFIQKSSYADCVGWLVVKTLYVKRRSLYFIHSLILSHCRHLRMQGIGAVATERESSGCFEVCLLDNLKVHVQCVAVIESGMNYIVAMVLTVLKSR